ncbi:MAG: hypothetical protein IJF08_04850 [Clostridia bacterium]|nr:hypothetical protein [Clostridia bacterium]
MNYQTNHSPESSTPLPRPLMLALARNMHAMQDYAKLSDAGRDRLIALARTAKSQQEIAALLQNLAQFS